MIRIENSPREKANRLENYSRKYRCGNPTSAIQCAPEVEIAHRLGSVARSMIVRVHRRTVRDDILRIAKREKVLEIRGMKLCFFADLTTETVRASFREVKHNLWKAGVKHEFIPPATLILTYNGESKRFTDHLSAEAFYKAKIEPGKLHG